ncbi:hypothetical protein M405DRAFT_563583 [Rhizopogon salebrosus TDB-379]|nr:hypothetical protein M405DRAFT_563583 [Rhizopogon salebrosus TDB-379]
MAMHMKSYLPNSPRTWVISLIKRRAGMCFCLPLLPPSTLIPLLEPLRDPVLHHRILDDQVEHAGSEYHSALVGLERSREVSQNAHPSMIRRMPFTFSVDTPPGSFPTTPPSLYTFNRSITAASTASSSEPTQDILGNSCQRQPQPAPELDTNATPIHSPTSPKPIASLTPTRTHTLVPPSHAHQGPFPTPKIDAHESW